MPSNDIYMPETIRPTRLYIKQHSITGLKYFGKTIRDPYTYLGSGTRWKNHIKKHGIKFVDTLWVSEPYTDAKLIKEIALKFSTENDIINSAEWANLKFEDGLEGGGNLNLSEESLKKCRQYGSLGGIKTRNNKSGIFALTSEERSQAAIKGKEACLSKYGVKSIFSLLNKDPEFIEKRKEIFAKNGHQQGEKNSQFGKIWIYNLELKLSKVIKKEELPNYESAGWIKGRRMNFS